MDSHYMHHYVLFTDITGVRTGTFVCHPRSVPARFYCYTGRSRHSDLRIRLPAHVKITRTPGGCVRSTSIFRQRTV
jgi:hypothetical protein